MNPSLCQLLDDYLAHDLIGDQRARFAVHLSHCAECRRTVHEHQRLEALLTEATARLVPVPVGLAERIERRVRAARWRRLAAGAALLAGTAAAIWLCLRNAAPIEAPPIPIAEVRPEPPTPTPPRPADLVHVRFPAGANVLAVTAKTESPNLTFIWVYRGLREPPRSASAADDLPSTPERSQP